MQTAIQVAMTIAQVVSLLAAAIGLPFLLQRNLIRRDEATAKKCKQQEEETRRVAEGERQKAEERAEARRRESLMVLKGIGKIGCLARATGIAVRDGHINGEMKTALEKYEEYDDELEDFLRSQTARTNH